jgi:hypothetical protein
LPVSRAHLVPEAQRVRQEQEGLRVLVVLLGFKAVEEPRGHPDSQYTALKDRLAREGQMEQVSAFPVPEVQWANEVLRDYAVQSAP